MRQLVCCRLKDPLRMVVKVLEEGVADGGADPREHRQSQEGKLGRGQ